MKNKIIVLMMALMIVGLMAGSAAASDLDAVSYRMGVGYERSFADNWDFNAGLDYLYLEMDDDEEGNVYSNGFSYTAGLTYNF